MMNAALRIDRSGAHWRDFPEKYGSWKTVCTRFKNGEKDYIFEDIFAILIIDADYQNLSSDSTRIKDYEHAVAEKQLKSMLP